MNPSFIAPQYGGHCFADLPATLQYWLTGEGTPSLAPDVLGDYTRKYDLVILFFIDSFGWEFFEKYADDYAFLKHLTRYGRVSKITSQFPSTTAAHVTCIHTGLPVGKNGVYEWQYYEPQLDAEITPLLFSYAGTMQRDQLKAASVDPTKLYPSQTIYESLAAKGVKSFTFGSRDFTPSTYSNVVMRGAEMRPYFSLSDSLVNLAAQAEQGTGTQYLFFYYGVIDTLAHNYGPNSFQTRVEIDMFLNALEKWFLPYVRRINKNSLFVMTADHGHMAVTKENVRYLNLDANLKKILPLLRTDHLGNVLPPAGSPRDAFLYVRDDALDEAYALLSDALQGYADVVRTNDLLQGGYFGKLPVCAELLGRLGNVTILPYEHNCVWWYEKDKFEQRHLGHHGGLTPTEMEIPLALLDLSE